MKIKNRWEFGVPFWKFQFKEENGEGGTGGSGGGGDGNASGGTSGEGGTGDPSGGTSKEGEGTSQVDPIKFQELETNFKKLSEDHQKLAEERTQYKGFYDSVSPYLKRTESGEYEYTNPNTTKTPTKEEKIDEATLKKSAEVAHTIAESFQISNQAEIAVKNSNKEDEFLEENMKVAQDIMKGVSVHKKTQAAWENAYILAKGRNAKKYVESAYKKGKDDAMTEFAKSSEGSSLSGGKTVGTSGEVDLSKITLTSAELKTAKAMVNRGLIKNIDIYKKRKYELSHQRGNDEGEEE